MDSDEELIQASQRAEEDLLMNNDADNESGKKYSNSICRIFRCLDKAHEYTHRYTKITSLPQ